jgi:hypothetical protein
MYSFNSKLNNKRDKFHSAGVKNTTIKYLVSTNRLSNLQLKKWIFTMIYQSICQEVQIEKKYSLQIRN